MTGDVRFRMLGPLGVSVEGRPVEIGAPRQRALLAMLLLEANRALRPAELIEGIWGDAIPQHPDAALQIVVSRLRSALGVLSERLTSGPGGYRIDVGDDELDLLRARRAFVLAQSLWDQHDFAGAAAASDAALQCWTGEPFTDLREAPFHDRALHDLRELRFSIYEFRNRAYLRCGRHVEVLVDIDAWSRLEPWRERTRAHHMVALYRSGRRVDALAVYDDLRACLADDLGVDPSTFMQELHAQIVDQDPALLARRAGIVVALPAWTPTAMPYVGRHREETQIFERLREVAAGGTRMIIVEGEAGIGKSRLVLEAARRVHDEAIVLAVDGADALQPGLHVIAAALADASSHLSDDELGLCLGRWPGDLAAIVPALRRRLPDLPPPLDADDETRGARMRAAIVSWIGGLSQRAPIIVLLDDIHRASPALLLLVGALLVDEEPKRVLVLATARSGAADRSSRLEQLARSLQHRGVIDRIELKGLTLDSVGRLLAELSMTDAPGLAEQLTSSTHGHPYLLGELLREPDSGLGAPTTDDVTSRVRHFVLRRVATLGGPGACLLGVAAAFDGEFDASLLAEVSHGTVQTTQVLIDQAVDAGLLHVTGLGTFDFVHDLARRAIAESLDDEIRAEVHADIATVLERRGVSAARVASQWSRAAGADAIANTVRWSERAADDALHDLDPHAAAAWFGLAAAHASDERARAQLLIRCAGAQCQAGEKAGAETLREALEIVRRLDDGDLLVEAAALSAPLWASMPTLLPAERVALLAEGSNRASDVGTRARLRARLASELMFTPEWKRARELADAALAEARSGGDGDALAEVLLRRSLVTSTPHNLAERRRDVTEAVAIAEAGRDPSPRFFALGLAAAVAIEAARLDEADAYVEAACEVARVSELPLLAYSAECVRSWRTGLAGDLDESERLAFRAIECGMRSGVERAEIGPAFQIGAIRWQQGRYGELLPILSANRNDDDRGGSVLLARALAEFDETRDEAVAVLTTAAGNDFDDLPLGMLWAAELVIAGEAAFLLGCPSVGATVRRLLEPFADQTSFNGTWLIAPLAYGAGLGAAAAGETGAEELLQQALTVCDRLHAPVLRARTETAIRRVRSGRAGDVRGESTAGLL